MQNIQIFYGDSVMFVVTCSVSNDSTQIPDYDSHTPNLSDFFFFEPSICHYSGFSSIVKVLCCCLNLH